MDPTAVLLGAGASVPAGGPTIDVLRSTFETRIKKHNFSEHFGRVYSYVKDTLQQRLGYEPDFEILLTAMDDIYDYFHEEQIEVPDYKWVGGEDGDVVEVEKTIWMPVRSTLHYFFEEPSSPFRNNELDGLWGFIQWVRDLRIQFLRHLLESLDAIDSSKSPLGFICELATVAADSDTGPVDVFTLNYDTLLEDTCSLRRVPWTDGFMPRWNPYNFDRLRIGVRVHKLHGSANWVYRRLGNEYSLKRVQELHKEDPQDRLLIYPLLVKKANHPTFTELLARFERSLFNAKKLMVIGSSLKDESLRAHIVHAHGLNSKLRTCIVSPDALEVRGRLIGSGIMLGLSNQLQRRIFSKEMGVESFQLGDFEF